MAKRPKKPKKTAKPKKPKPAAPGAAAARLLPPPNGATVRMYRIGHGDCFLVAFAGKTADQPVYLLIDCGYKPGSPDFLDSTPKEITANIAAATGGHLDIAVITHEHQDHVNGITAASFKDITIGEAWFAWTEDPEDERANELRKQHHDKLLGLLAARQRLAAAQEHAHVTQLDQMLAFELGVDVPAGAKAAAALLGAAAKNPANSFNKKSMKLIKDRAKTRTRFLRPHQKIIAVPGASGARAFVLGPPKNDDLLTSLDPVGSEGFHSMGPRSAGSYFAAAATAGVGAGSAPFAPHYGVIWDPAKGLAAGAGAPGADLAAIMKRYGKASDPAVFAPGADHDSEAPLNAPWRRIDRDWLYSADQLALDLNDYTNNSSLVLAFELSKGGKVLLFAADAQRGNWHSWAKKQWTDGDAKVTAKELLARTVLYKVGHHGSHNATLDGELGSEYPNLAWMATGDESREFTAMITAVRKWAETQEGWDHPLKSIKDALLHKASGRVFQTDTDFSKMTKSSAADWKGFESRTTATDLYFDLQIHVD